MLFNSYIFLFIFFPICLLGYYGLLHGQKPVAARVFLTAMSFWFYGYFNLSYLLIMVCSIGVNFLFHRLLSQEEAQDRENNRKRYGVSRRAVMIAAVAFNLGVLFYFKYFDFFLATVNGVFGASFALRGILLPLGISFFTFQQISFVVDTYWGEVKNCPLDEYALFVSFFPQLIAGPIVNHSEMLPQFEKIGEKTPDWERIAGGFALFTMGLAKKVLLADTFGAGVDYGYENMAALGRMDAVLVVFSYAFQLYFDFSGYCDMAVGISRMLGIEIPENFCSPFKAVNIIDFWKRWHITLNRFFTKYVYIPLGGNRRGEGRMYLNFLIIFFLSGLWHGAGFHYIIWGMLQGVLYVATRFWQKRIKPAVSGGAERLSGFGRKIVTHVSQTAIFLYACFSWVYFRAEDVGQANRFLMTIFRGKVQKLSMDLAECFQVDELWYVLKVLHLDHLSVSRYIPMFVILAAGLYFSMIGKNAAERTARFKYRADETAVIVVLMVWCVLSFSGVSTFLYFNF